MKSWYARLWCGTYCGLKEDTVVFAQDADGVLDTDNENSDIVFYDWEFELLLKVAV